MLIDYDRNTNHFVVKCTPNQHDTLVREGFLWCDTNRRFQTSNIQLVEKHKEHATPFVHKLLDQRYIRVTNTFTADDVVYPKNLSLRNYQVSDIVFALNRNRAYLAVDPGLGKTIEAICVHNTQPRPVVYLCPPFLLKDVARKYDEWGTAFFDVDLHSTAKPFLDPSCFNIVSDSRMHSEEFAKIIRKFAIDNPTAMLIIDEAHRYKAVQSKRTDNLFRHAATLFEKIILLSGTPMPNRIAELYMPVSRFAPECIDFMNFEAFAFEYCGGYYKDGVLNYTGASSTGILFNRLKLFMKRTKKKDVLTELPPKTIERVYIPNKLPTDLRKIEEEIQALIDPSEIAIVDLEQTIANSIGVDALEMSTYRKELGKVKVEGALTFVKDILTNTEANVLVFGVHKEVIALLAEGLNKYNPSVVTGATPMNKRQAQVDRFQNGETRLFIGNIQACGVGFTLTAATRVVFVEWSWVPGENSQAIDRAHRIGQKDSVHAQFLMFQNSLDERIYQTNQFKEKVIEQL